jgi:lysophospholipase L1-like esterase
LTLVPARRTFLAVALGVALLAPAPRLADARSGQAPRLAEAGSQATGGIVFVGSSIFHRWTSLASQMAPLPITNLAIDGTMTTDMLRMVDARVIPLRPKVVAYYCGSNDVDAGEPAPAIVGRILQFVDRVAKALPDARVIFVSVNRAPEKQDRWDVVDEVNRQIQKYAAAHPRVEFVDVNPVLFNADGTSRLDLFMGDQLHLRPRAYEEFAKILKPVLTRALNPPGRT